MAGVVNASRSISGRYPNLGPLILLQAGIPLVDAVGPLLLRKVREGDPIRLEGDRILVRDALVGVGIRQSEESVLGAMSEAKLSLAERFESFATNTIDYIHRERDLLFGGSGLPTIEHDLTGRAVLVVVRGYDYKEDLGGARAVHPRRPPRAPRGRRRRRRADRGRIPARPDPRGHGQRVGRRPAARAWRADGDGSGGAATTEILLHAYQGGRAPGKARLDALGIPYRVVEASGTSEDVAFLLAHEKGADAIVAVGSHGNLREFLDKGREGMASTFLVRLRVGEILMDAKGVSRVYSPRVRTRDALLLVGAAIVAIAAVVVISPPLRLYVSQLFEQFRQWLSGLSDLL